MEENTETKIRTMLKNAQIRRIKVSTDHLENAILETNKILAKEGLMGISISPSCSSCYFALNDERYHEEMKCLRPKSSPEEYASELWEKLRNSYEVIDAIREKREGRKLRDQLNNSKDTIHQMRSSKTRVERKLKDSQNEVAEIKQNLYKMA